MNKTLPCACHSEELHLEWDDEFNQLNISIWEPYGTHRFSFWHRLRHCWKILKTGIPYGDQVLLDKKSINSMINFLKQIP
jgi:hypothetical protein